MILTNPIAIGNTADIYLCDGKLIKLFKDSPPGAAEYEANKQRYARAQGLPIPQVFEVAGINGKQAIIMEYISGNTIGDMISSDMTKAEQYMSLSVDVQLKIHDVQADGFELMTDKLTRQLCATSALNCRGEIIRKCGFQRGKSAP